MKDYKITYVIGGNAKEEKFNASIFAIKRYTELSVESMFPLEPINDLKIFKITRYQNGNSKEEDITLKVNRSVYYA